MEKSASVNRKRAGVGPAPWSIRNVSVGLKTMPVGEDAETSSGTFEIGSTPFAPR